MRPIEERPYALHFPEGEGRTEQAHAGEADINSIMAKATKGGMTDYVQQHEPHYGDASGPDFMAANILVANANTMFEDLPADIRAKFKNNPEEFLEFVNNGQNLQEMYKLGLSNRPTVDDPPIPETPPETT